MLEIIVLALFIFGGFLYTVGWNAYLNRRDRRQEAVLADLMIAAHSQPIEVLRKRLGDPYEIEAAPDGSRTLYIWKFPPADTIPPGRGLITLTATIETGAVIDIVYNRKRS